jgi:hypothetical protein
MILFVFQWVQRIKIFKWCSKFSFKLFIYLSCENFQTKVFHLLFGFQLSYFVFSGGISFSEEVFCFQRGILFLEEVFHFASPGGFWAMWPIKSSSLFLLWAQLGPPPPLSSTSRPNRRHPPGWRCHAACRRPSPYHTTQAPKHSPSHSIESKKALSPSACQFYPATKPQFVVPFPMI